MPKNGYNIACFRVAGHWGDMIYFQRFETRKTTSERQKSMATGKLLDGKPDVENPHIRLNVRNATLDNTRQGSVLCKKKVLLWRRVFAFLVVAACMASFGSDGYIVGDPGGRIVTGDGPILAKSGTGTSAETPLGVSSRRMGVSSNRNAWMRARGVALSNARRVQCRMPAFIIIIH